MSYLRRQKGRLAACRLGAVQRVAQQAMAGVTARLAAAGLAPAAQQCAAHFLLAPAQLGADYFIVSHKEFKDVFVQGKSELCSVLCNRFLICI